MQAICGVSLGKYQCWIWPLATKLDESESPWSLSDGHCFFVLFFLQATWRSAIRTAVFPWRRGIGTWPAAMTSWDLCPLASRSCKNWEWMDGKTEKEEEEGERRWPCSLARRWRTAFGLGPSYRGDTLWQKGLCLRHFIACFLSLSLARSSLLSSLHFCWHDCQGV